ncbi:MAG: Tetratricopeptide repeat [Blastocatellia bacterium]|nr:Tetratricopeptide repeat [Blastocatellia bacterium]
MAYLCPSCNSPSPTEARFCRLCGAPLKTAGGLSGPISPLAQTVPLSIDGRTTDGLADERHANTARVGSAELDSILRNQRLAQIPVTANGDDGLAADYSGEQYAAPTTSSLVLPAAAQPQAKRKRWWPIVLLTFFFLALAAGLLVYYLRHRDSNAGPLVANVDQSRLVAQQLGEARSLLAAGNIKEAIERLHSVVNLDPANVEAHRLLGAAFMRNGQRRQAIDEYFAAAQRDPGDVDTLHMLASLQFQGQLYADAIDSYRRLKSAMGDTAFSPRDQLEYADALRLAGYTEDSRVEYQKLLSGAPDDIVATAKQRLTQLPGPTASNVSVNARLPLPAPASSASTAGGKTESPGGATQTAVATKAAVTLAQQDQDHNYSLSVSIIAGRDPKNLPRPELLRALAAAQRAALDGKHRDEAKRLAEKLGREFDRRRNSGVQ